MVVTGNKDPPPLIPPLPPPPQETDMEVVELELDEPIQGGWICCIDWLADMTHIDNIVTKESTAHMDSCNKMNICFI